jgi:hypothetical protein
MGNYLFIYFVFLPKFFDGFRQKFRQKVLSRGFLRFLHFFKKIEEIKNVNKLPGFWFNRFF